MLKFIQWWYSFWIRVAYFLRLRKPAIKVQRWLKGEHKAKREPLPSFSTPKEIEIYAQERFDYRLDQTRVGGLMIPLDWVTEPEVFQARLVDNVQKDGDCDDYHFWFANCLDALDAVEDVMLLSVGYPTGGHAVCVYKLKGDEGWHLVNYRLRGKFEDVNDVPMNIAEWGTDEPKEPAVYWYAFETMDFEPIVISPKKI